MKELRGLFICSAIPMVGFGFMDNAVMIQAGQTIDSTLGVQLGLATLTAAAAGQVVSDVSGVLFGGTLERLLTGLRWMPRIPLSPAQEKWATVRNVRMAGAVLGVIVGCALGATTLLFVDLQARDRLQRASMLQQIVADMLQQEFDAGRLHCRRCTVFFVSTNTQDHFTFQQRQSSSISKEGDADDEKEQLPAFATIGSQQRHPEKKSHVKLTRRATVSTTATSVRLRLMDDYESLEKREQHPQLVERAVTKRQVLAKGKVAAAPIISRTQDQALLAVVQFYHDDDEEESHFTEQEVQTMQVMSRHLAIFMDRLVE